MRIAVFHELNNGGARRAANEIAKKLKEKHVVDLFIVDEKENVDEKCYFSDIHFFSYNNHLKKNHTLFNRMYVDSFGLLALLLLHRKIARQINESGYDVVLVHSSKYTQSPFLLPFLQIPQVYYAHEYLRMVYDPLLNKINGLNFLNRFYEKLFRKNRKYIDAFNCSKAKSILVNSQFSKKNIKNAYGKNSQVCYLGVDADLFYDQKIAKKYDVLYLGSKHEVDGYSMYVEIKKYTKKMHHHSLLGFKSSLTDEDLVKIYNQSKLVLCLSRNEPFGLISLEAMSCGVPVIALDEGGYKESILNGQTGYLVQNSRDEIVEKMNILLANNQLHSRMVQNAKEWVKNWNWEKTARVVEKELRKVFVNEKRKE